MVMEIGAPEYTRDFFDPDTRYDCLAARSLGHSVPVINGYEQGAGRGFRAQVNEAVIARDAVSFVADLSYAYPAEAGCRKFIRTIRLKKTEGLFLLDDEIVLGSPGEIESAFITDAEMVNIEASNLAAIVKGSIRLELNCGISGFWDRIDTKSYKNHSGGHKEIQRLVLKTTRRAAYNHLRIIGSLK
jgi:hypothetical protein